MTTPPRANRFRDWPTLALLIGTYALWAWGTTGASQLWLPLGMIIVTLTGAMHASLTHEVCHGHPTRHAVLNAALVFPVLTLFVPYMRFKDTHLAHHLDARLTDPYDDPESNYLDPVVWDALPAWRQRLLIWNNTLLGRLLLGPALGQIAFMAGDFRLIRSGDRRVILGWLLHLPSVALVLAWIVLVADMALWAFLVSVYAANALLKVRTFLEHQAHERARGRTVIIEDRGFWAFLFLNNNLHVVHHMHPRMPWFRLPRVYRENKQRYLTRNSGYVFRNYRQIFGLYLTRTKDPVPHPLWSSDR